MRLRRMIRRFYVLPLRPTVGHAKIAELLAALRATDAYIPGLLNASAGLDPVSRTRGRTWSTCATPPRPTTT